MNTTRRGFLGGLLALAAIPLAKVVKTPEPVPDGGPFLTANVWGTPRPITEEMILRANRAAVYGRSKRYYIGYQWPVGY